MWGVSKKIENSKRLTKTNLEKSNIWSPTWKSVDFLGERKPARESQIPTRKNRQAQIVAEKIDQDQHGKIEYLESYTKIGQFFRGEKAGSRKSDPDPKKPAGPDRRDFKYMKYVCLYFRVFILEVFNF